MFSRSVGEIVHLFGGVQVVHAVKDGKKVEKKRKEKIGTEARGR